MPESQSHKRLPAAEFLSRLQDTVLHFPDLDDSQKQAYIDEHMKRAGYKPTTTWGDPDSSPEGGKAGGGWFPS